MRFFKKSELKLLGPFYLEALISTIFFIYATFDIIYFKSISFSLTQIGIIIGSLTLGTFLFEIPTGAIADIFGRKFSVTLGQLLSGTIFIIIYFLTTFTQFLIAFFILGLSLTLVSGANTAWIMDNLKVSKKEDLMQEYFIKRNSIISFSLVISGILGAFLVKQYGLKIIWISTGLAFLVSALIFILTKEKKILHKKEKNTKEIFKQSKDSFKYAIKHPVLFLLILSSFFLVISFGFSGDMIWQPFLISLGLPIYALGYLTSIFAFFSIFTPYLSKLLLKRTNEKNLLSTLSLIGGLLLILVLFANEWIFAAIIMTLFYLLFTIGSPVRSHFFQKHVPSKKRATITSVESMFTSLAVIISSPLAGFLADNLGYKSTLLIGGIVALITGITYYKIRK